MAIQGIFNAVYKYFVNHQATTYSPILGSPILYDTLYVNISTKRDIANIK